MMRIKPNTVVIGFNESPFKRGDTECQLIGCVYRGGRLMEELVTGIIQVDGNDATETIIRLVKGSKCLEQIKVILVGSITLAGFNIVDLSRVHEETQIPVVSIFRRAPNQGSIKELLGKLGMDEKIPLLDRGGKIHEDCGIFFQTAGITYDEVIEILELTMTEADYPEPLRMAKIIGRGLVHDED